MTDQPIPRPLVLEREGTTITFTATGGGRVRASLAKGLLFRLERDIPREDVAQLYGWLGAAISPSKEPRG